MNILEQEKGSSLMSHDYCMHWIYYRTSTLFTITILRYFLSSLHTILYLWLNQINIQILPSRP